VLLAALIFIAGIVLLVKGADYFVEGGAGLARRIGVPPSVIGFTVIAFGTSLPEFVVSINAVFSGNEDIALGNVVGSNIANIAFVLALCALLNPLVISLEAKTRTLLIRQTALMLAATAVFFLLTLRGVLDIFSGIISLVVFAFILRSLFSGESQAPDVVQSKGYHDIIYTLAGLIAVTFGSQLALDGAVTIAENLGIPTFVIGLSMVAVGTSLPELATSVVAILKGNPGISVGNILGSNIFNLLFVMGFGSLLRPVSVTPGIFSSIIIAVLVSVAVLPLFSRSNMLTRLWAAMLLCGYFFYMAYLFGVF
jgi:cation:H+ antiporter